MFLLAEAIFFRCKKLKKDVKNMLI